MSVLKFGDLKLIQRSAQVVILTLICVWSCWGYAQDIDFVEVSLALKRESSIANAEKKCAELLEEYKGDPKVLGWVHAAMAFKRCEGQVYPNYEKVSDDVDKALERPIGARLACKMFQLKGDLLQKQMRDVKFADIEKLRQSALTQYLRGLLIVQDGLTESQGGKRNGDKKWPLDMSIEELNEWSENFQGSIEYIYIDNPTKKEVLSCANEVHLSGQALESLLTRLGVTNVMGTTGSERATDNSSANESTVQDLSQYEVEGKINEVIMFSKGKPREAIVADFTVAVDGCRWDIKTVERDEAGNALQKEEIYSFDGIKVVDLVTAAVAPNSRQRPITVATVSTNSVPMASTDRPLISHLWLMFASRCYLANLKTNQLIPVFDYAASAAGDSSIRLDAKLEFVSGPGSFLNKVVYYNGGGHYNLISHTNVVFTRYYPPFDHGFTNAVYALSLSKDFNGVTFPSGFTFEEYGPSGPSKYDLWLKKRAEAIVTAVRKGAKIEVAPDLPKEKTIVVNNLLEQRNGKIPTFLIHKDRLSDLAKSNTNTKTKFVRLVLICALCLLPAIIALLNVKRLVSRK